MPEPVSQRRIARTVLKARGIARLSELRTEGVPESMLATFRSFTFDDDRLPRAIAATFARRGTPIPQEPPDALTMAFAEDVQKQRQWQAFIGDVALDPGDLGTVIRDLAAFLLPQAASAVRLSK